MWKLQTKQTESNAMSANAKTVVFKVEKTTKNTVKFAEKEVPGQPQIVGALYIQKWAVPAGCVAVVVTINFPDDKEVDNYL